MFKVSKDGKIIYKGGYINALRLYLICYNSSSKRHVKFIGPKNNILKASWR